MQRHYRELLQRRHRHPTNTRSGCARAVAVVDAHDQAVRRSPLGQVSNGIVKRSAAGQPRGWSVSGMGRHVGVPQNTLTTEARISQESGPFCFAARRLLPLNSGCHAKVVLLRMCLCTPSPQPMVLAARDVRGPQRASCSETPHPTGCSRMGTTEVKRIGRVRLAGSGCWTFNPATRVRIPYATPYLVSSGGFRAAVYEAEGRTFESCTRCHYLSVNSV